MTPQQLSAQASQAAVQGRQMLSSDQSNAQQYRNAYNSDTTQAATANQNLKQYTNYIQNAGNPLNLYNTGITQGEQAQGFDPRVLATATQNLTGTENAINQVNNASQSSTGGYGLSGSQLGSYYGSISQPLQQAAQAQNNAVGNYQQLYQNALTQGQQGAALGFQGEQQTSSNLNQVYQNAQNQASQALSMVQFFHQLASTQGGLNAQQQQYYASAIQGYTQAQAAMVQAQAAAQQAAVAAQVAPSTEAYNRALAAQTQASILKNQPKGYNPTIKPTIKVSTSSGGLPLNVSGGSGLGVNVSGANALQGGKASLR